MAQTGCFGKLSSASRQDLRVDWASGRFEIASRGRTDHVAGCIGSDRHMIMMTLRGGAARHRFTTDDGLAHDAPDVAGSVSFLPAGCGRKLELSDVAWTWAAISVPANAGARDAGLRSLALSGEPFLCNLFAELDRTAAREGGVDALYASSLCAAAWEYMLRRHLHVSAGKAMRGGLPAWRLRRVRDFVEANLDQPVSMAELAALCDLSERQFFRAFKTSTGTTPLQIVQSARVEAAKRLLLADGRPVCTIAHQVGFVSASHFARTFRKHVRMLPQDYRRHAGAER